MSSAWIGSLQVRLMAIHATNYPERVRTQYALIFLPVCITCRSNVAPAYLMKHVGSCNWAYIRSGLLQILPDWLKPCLYCLKFSHRRMSPVLAVRSLSRRDSRRKFIGRYALLCLPDSWFSYLRDGYMSHAQPSLLIGVGSLHQSSAVVPYTDCSSVKDKRPIAFSVVAFGSSVGGVIFPVVFRQLLPRIGYVCSLRCTTYGSYPGL